MSYEGEPAACYTRTLPCARKPHRCCECFGWIEKGEFYERFSGVWDGNPATFKTCGDCNLIRRKIGVQNEPIAFTSISEFLQESEDYSSELSLEFLRVKVKRGAPISKFWWPILRARQNKP